MAPFDSSSYDDIVHPNSFSVKRRSQPKENVAASTQNQALSALLCLYREVLHQDLGPVDALRAKRPKRLPTVLTKDETLGLISCLSGTHQVMAKLIYEW
jgi:integrase